MALVDTDNLLKRFSRYLRLERGLSENTIAGYMSDVEKLVDFIDSENLDWRTVTGADLHQFVATLQDLGIGARSQARIISGIKSFFNFLRMEKCIHTNPSELIETPKLGMKLPDVLTVEEVDELVNSFDLSKPEEHCIVVAFVFPNWWGFVCPTSILTTVISSWKVRVKSRGWFLFQRKRLKKFVLI